MEAVNRLGLTCGVPGINWEFICWRCLIFPQFSPHQLQEQQVHCSIPSPSADSLFSIQIGNHSCCCFSISNRFLSSLHSFDFGSSSFRCDCSINLTPKTEFASIRIRGNEYPSCCDNYYLLAVKWFSLVLINIACNILVCCVSFPFAARLYLLVPGLVLLGRLLWPGRPSGCFILNESI